MPWEQLRALSADMNRLLAAGGAVAAGDEGLRRRAAALRELGRRVPALIPIADAAGRAAAAPPAQATRALLDLLLIVRQVRAGLAAAGAEGPLEPVEASGPWTTETDAPDLYPVLETLSSPADPRRPHAVRDLAHLGGAADLRLVEPLLTAMDQARSEVAECAGERILPTFGPTILPELRRRLKLKGHATLPVAWRLALWKIGSLHRLDLREIWGP